MRCREKPTLFVLCAAAIIYAGYVPAALWLGRSFERPVIPIGKIVVQLTHFERVEGFAFGSRAPRLREFEDDQPSAQRSPVIMFEDDKRLWPPHSSHYDIEYSGQGRYSHWKGIGVLFATSDNSDPNKNGRRYWAVIPEE
jgi:hypothetical protein